jgi:HD-GYP domain-containing protein (c-di-GMP phosphodiesterase class II)
MVIEAVHCHHEQPNGEGFPHGLKSKNIPLLAGICAIADSLDHIIINRNEEPSDMQDAAQYIMSKSGIVFGETAALIFEQCLGSLSALYAKQDDAQ